MELLILHTVNLLFALQNDLSSIEEGPAAGSFKHDNKFSGSIKGGNFLNIWATIRLSRMFVLRWVGYVSAESADIWEVIVGKW
jgi:hypothetical protein